MVGIYEEWLGVVVCGALFDTWSRRVDLSVGVESFCWVAAVYHPAVGVCGSNSFCCRVLEGYQVKWVADVYVTAFGCHIQCEHSVLVHDESFQETLLFPSAEESDRQAVGRVYSAIYVEVVSSVAFAAEEEGSVV